MPLILSDRVKETTTTTGTGTVTLAGAVAGFQAFSVIGNGNTTYYCIVDSATGAWETGLGTYSSTGPTLARTTVLESSNSNALVNFAAGSKDVFVTYPADKAVVADNLVIISGPTAARTVTFPDANFTAARTDSAQTFTGTQTFGGSVVPATNTVDSVGYTGMPQNSQSAAYTLVAGDAGKTVVHPITDNNARTFTIPANGTVAYPVGTTITFVNMINTVTIAITTDTMYLAGAGTTGSRTLAAYGVASAIKVTSTSWIISGNGLT